MTTFADETRLAALLHSEFCIPLEGERPTWEPDERGTHLPHQPYYLERAARLIAAGVRVGDDAGGLRAALEEHHPGFEPGDTCTICGYNPGALAARLIAQGVRVGDDGLHSDGDVCTGLTCGNPEHGWSTR